MQLDPDHLYFDLSKQVKQLFKPLFRYTPLNHFDYQRQYYDGTTLLLFGKSPKFVTQYFENELYPTLSEVLHVRSRYILLASEVELPEELDPLSKYRKNIQLAQEAEIQHRLCIVQHYPHYCEIFCFGSHQPLAKMLDFYMNNKELLEKFIIYFKESARSLIKLGEANKVKMNNFIDISGETVLSRPQANYNELLKALELKKYHILRPTGLVKLTRRELECLALTTQRFSAKEVAKSLKLSPRTVEEYLNNLKIKLGCQGKYDLIELAKEDSHLKSLLELF
jgi:DNA-binding CsgD family transcriptional regulator